MENFRNSTIDELFGPSRLASPIMPGEINWPQIATTTVIIVAVAATTGLIIYGVMKSHNNKMMAAMKESRERQSMARQSRQMTDQEIAERLWRNRK